METLLFRKALPTEAGQIAVLINRAYRGDHSRQGWTTEADLLDGLRTSSTEIESLIASEHYMILLCLQGAIIVGSVCLEHMGEHVHLGMFVVEPKLQNAGIGKQLLAYAEAAAEQQWQARSMVMAVITHRQELIAYYERRGYLRTGRLQQFPANPMLWQPKVQGLQLEILEKKLTKTKS
jgi:ribosomal protein S18 acetylase RimI-like enzyme